MANTGKPKNGIIEPRINSELYGEREVRLVYKENKGSESPNDFNRIVTMSYARALSAEKHLDLIEINQNSKPVVVLLANYSKYLYELKKQNKLKGKNKVELKEIRLKTNISEHDLDIKIKHAEEFLNDGDKVKVVITMKGRELSRKDESKKSFYTFIDKILDGGVGTIENAPHDEERSAYVIFKPKKK